MGVTVRVPFTVHHPQARPTLGRHAKGWAAYRLNPGNPGAYHQWLAAMWAAGRDLAIVEHDIGVHAGVVPQWEACDRPWCTFAYPGPGGRVLTEGLGCVRFRAELLVAHPEVPRLAEGGPDADDVPARDWRRLDVRVSTALRGLGHAPHVHTPHVQHWHHYTEPGQPCGCPNCTGG